MQIPPDSSTQCASAGLDACSFGMHSNDEKHYLSPRTKPWGAMSESKMQVQKSCHNFYYCAGHHNLAKTTLVSLQSTANATVSGRAH